MFLGEYLYKKDQETILNNAYRGVVEMFLSQVEEAKRNQAIAHIQTFKHINFQRVDIGDAIYSVFDMLNNSSLMAGVGISPELSYSQKLALWNDMSPLKKSEILEIAGYFIEFTSSNIETDGKLLSNRFDVIDFELSDLKNNVFIRNIDYYFRDNKLFLLKEIVMENVYKNRFLLLKNITIDINSTEDILGATMNLPYSEDFTKTDYNETLKSFIEASANGPVINLVNDSLSKYNTLDGVKVYDKYNATSELRGFWNYGNSIGTLTDFDFLVDIPIILANRPEKLEYIISFFKKIKPSHTNFIFSPSLKLLDNLSATDNAYALNAFSVYDRITAADESVFKASITPLDTMLVKTVSNVTVYDSHFYCDDAGGVFTDAVDDSIDYETAFSDDISIQLIPK